MFLCLPWSLSQQIRTFDRVNQVKYNDFDETSFLFEKKSSFICWVIKHFRTAHLAKMMGEELKKKDKKDEISDEDILCLEVAGLCHDLG